MRMFNDSFFFFMPVSKLKESPLTLDILGSRSGFQHQRARVSQSLRTCDQSKVGVRSRCRAVVTMAIQVAAKRGVFLSVCP